MPISLDKPKLTAHDIVDYIPVVQFFSAIVRLFQIAHQHRIKSLSQAGGDLRERKIQTVSKHDLNHLWALLPLGGFISLALDIKEKKNYAKRNSLPPPPPAVELPQIAQSIVYPPPPPPIYIQAAENTHTVGIAMIVSEDRAEEFFESSPLFLEDMQALPQSTPAKPKSSREKNETLEQLKKRVKKLEKKNKGLKSENKNLKREVNTLFSVILAMHNHSRGQKEELSKLEETISEYKQAHTQEDSNAGNSIEDFSGKNVESHAWKTLQRSPSFRLIRPQSDHLQTQVIPPTDKETNNSNNNNNNNNNNTTDPNYIELNITEENIPELEDQQVDNLEKSINEIFSVIEEESSDKNKNEKEILVQVEGQSHSLLDQIRNFKKSIDPSHTNQVSASHKTNEQAFVPRPRHKYAYEQAVKLPMACSKLLTRIDDFLDQLIDKKNGEIDAVEKPEDMNASILLKSAIDEANSNDPELILRHISYFEEMIKDLSLKMKSYKLSADQKTQTSEIQTKPLIKNLEPFKEKLKVDWSLDSNRIFQTKFNQLVSSFIAEAKKINIYPIDSTHLNSYEEYKNFFQNFIQVFNKDLNKYTEAFESFDSETKTKEVGIRFNSSSYESLYKNLSQTIQYINAECSKKKTPLVSNSPVQPVVTMNQAVIPQRSPVDDLADSTGDWTVISDEEDFNPHVAFKKGQTLFQTS